MEKQLYHFIVHRSKNKEGSGTYQSNVPIRGWLWSWVSSPKKGVAQTSALAKWGAYLEQRSSLSACPLSQELQHILGPVTFTGETPAVGLGRHPDNNGMELESLPLKGDKPSTDVRAWYTDGSSRGQTSSWMAFTI